MHTDTAELDAAFKTAWRFRRRYGGNAEDLLSDSQEHYMRAVATYDPRRGSLGGWVRFVVWSQLLEARRTEARHHRIAPCVAFNLNALRARSRFDIRRFAFELSEDGKAVVVAALALPVRCRDRQQALLRALFAMGWSGVRIQRALREVRVALI